MEAKNVKSPTNVKPLVPITPIENFSIMNNTPPAIPSPAESIAPEIRVAPKPLPLPSILKPPTPPAMLKQSEIIYVAKDTTVQPIGHEDISSDTLENSQSSAIIEETNISSVKFPEIDHSPIIMEITSIVSSEVVFVAPPTSIVHKEASVTFSRSRVDTSATLTEDSERSIISKPTMDDLAGVAESIKDDELDLQKQSKSRVSFKSDMSDEYSSEHQIDSTNPPIPPSADMKPGRTGPQFDQSDPMANRGKRFRLVNFSMDVRRTNDGLFMDDFDGIFNLIPGPTHAARASISAVPSSGFQTNNPEKPRLRVKNVEYAKLKQHSGPIDQRALSSKPPVDLIKHIELVLLGMGLHVQRTSEEYKLRVIRPSAGTLTNYKNQSVSSDLGAPDSLDPRSERKGRFSSLTAFPLTLVRRFKYIAQFGTQYNSGFDSITDPSSFSNPPPSKQKEVSFYISLQRIKNLDGLLIVDVKRLKGDIWQFKTLYHQIVPKLELHEFKEFQAL